jgi:hypothetical protein
MSNHEHFEELAALSAGGFLSEQEAAELREHARNCAECLKAEQEFGEVLHNGMPLTSSPFREFVDGVRTQTDVGVRGRFLARARREGIRFSGDIERPQPARRWAAFFPFAAGAASAAIVLIASYAWIQHRNVVRVPSTKAPEQVALLEKQNADLNSALAQLKDSLSAQQRDVERLKIQLDAARAGQPHSTTTAQDVDMAKELESAQKQLADSRSEADRINAIHVDDLASLAVQQSQINDLSNRLRVASATLDMERQLVESGQNLRDLLLAKQLHVIDVRDTDPNGKPGRAFGRIFVTEGKSLTFYAFDLADSRTAGDRFEVWGSQQGTSGAPQKLGYLLADEKADRRWVLKVNSGETIKSIDSVFVSAEPNSSAQSPTGEQMLFAYLGPPHRP